MPERVEELPPKKNDPICVHDPRLLDGSAWRIDVDLEYPGVPINVVRTRINTWANGKGFRISTRKHDGALYVQACPMEAPVIQEGRS